jgi:hypothetical protein
MEWLNNLYLKKIHVDANLQDHLIPFSDLYFYPLSNRAAEKAFR